MEFLKTYDGIDAVDTTKRSTAWRLTNLPTCSTQKETTHNEHAEHVKARFASHHKRYKSVDAQIRCHARAKIYRWGLFTRATVEVSDI